MDFSEFRSDFIVCTQFCCQSLQKRVPWMNGRKRLLFFISSRVSGLLATCWYYILTLFVMQYNRKGHLFCVMIFEIDSGSVAGWCYTMVLHKKIRRIDRHAFSELRNKSRLPNNILLGLSWFWVDTIFSYKYIRLIVKPKNLSVLNIPFQHDTCNKSMQRILGWDGDERYTCPDPGK